MKIAAVDIGGTAIKYGMFENGGLTEIHEIPTLAKEGGESVIKRAADALAVLPKFDAIGISTAGQADSQGRIVYANKNLPGYTGMNIRSILEDRFHVPSVVLNDVHAAAIGEAAIGAGKNLDDFLMLTYGTGVGGAIWLNNMLYRGSKRNAGVFGGIVTHPGEMKAQDEFSGCYERYASASALVYKVQALDSSIHNGKDIFDKMYNPLVREAVDQWIFEIMTGLVTLIHIFNPKAVILGGGIMAQDYIIGKIRQEIYAYLSGGFQEVEIRKAALGNKAGMYGAAYQVSFNISE